MKRYGLAAAIGLLLAVNALVLANAARNRSNEYDAELRLTERELPVYRPWRRSDKENTGLSLRLDWETYSPPTIVKAKGKPSRRVHSEWFNAAKLESIGFDCSVPLDSPDAEMHYRKALSRKTFAVFEYEGKAWQDWRGDYEQRIAETDDDVRKGRDKKKSLLEIRKEFERELKTKSRLFAVDAGNDPVQLRRKYPDRARYVITPVRVGFYLRYGEVRNGKYELTGIRGKIQEVLIDEINVPRANRAILDGLIRAEKNGQYGYFGSYGYNKERPPYYTVTVRYGKRHEPWIVDIRKMTE